MPFGNRENNRGTIEGAADPGRSLVERVTNAIDAVLEREHADHSGRPECRSPKEAAIAWLNVPEGGLSGLSPAQRRALARRVTITLLEGEGRSKRVVEVSDRGIGLSQEEMPQTILSLNESNKLTKHYLAGLYGQGGSSTLVASEYTLIASRKEENGPIGFTVVKYLDLPPDRFRTGHYVYLTIDGSIPTTSLPSTEFPRGTTVRHVGYDLSGYPSPLGPNSLYGLLNMALFDPVLPVWLDNRIHDYRRVIKGSRNALNGAVDEGDEHHTGPTLSHHVPLFFVSIGDFGRIGMEYWVLEAPTTRNKTPSAAFVNPRKPVVLTLYGQNHAELSQVLIRKQAELPYLAQRLICHIDCNGLAPAAKRALFVSNREDARRGAVYELVERDLINALKSDDELARLNNEARDRSLRDRDESAEQHMRTEVARLLRLYGLNVTEPVGADSSETEQPAGRPTHPKRSRPRPLPLEVREPPTYIRLVLDEQQPVSFYPEQRRYIRLETDANSTYHDPNRPERSRINFIIGGDGLRLIGTTPLEGGRMRAIVEALATALVGEEGVVRVELSRLGLPTLRDERTFRIVARPPIQQGTRRISLPPFEVREVEGPNDDQWAVLGWPDEINKVASCAALDGGTLVVWYSTVFPRYAAQRDALERRDTALAESFTSRYKIWLAVHSLLIHAEEAGRSATILPDEVRDDSSADWEREERVRMATMSCLFAAREIELPTQEVEVG
jgi:hypothetical protein